MKKTMKKLTALTLIFMLLFSAFSVQASAGLFDKIVSVEPLITKSVTARELDEYITEKNNNGWVEETDYFYTVHMEYNVTLSTGEVIDVNRLGISEDEKRTVGVRGYIDIRDYQQTAENGAEVLPLYYEATLYSSVGIEMDYYEGITEIPLIECYVKSITHVSGLPETYKDIGSFGRAFFRDEKMLLEGAVFDVEYPDGRIVRESVEVIKTVYGFEVCMLDGVFIDYEISVNEGAIYIYYSDIIISEEIEIIPFPIDEIVIDDVIVSDDFKAESVTYTVTKTDGTKESFVYSFDTEPDINYSVFQGYTGCYIDGVPVLIFVDKYEKDEYPPREYISIGIISDYEVGDEVEIEGPAKEGTILGELIYRIRMFLIKVFEFIYYI